MSIRVALSCMAAVSISTLGYLSVPETTGTVSVETLVLADEMVLSEDGKAELMARASFNDQFSMQYSYENHSYTNFSYHNFSYSPSFSGFADQDRGLKQKLQLPSVRL